VEDVERKSVVNSFSAWTAAGDAPSGNAELNERSQIESRARPCATDARLPTVHIIEASSVSSNSRRSRGLRWAARTNGRVAEA
jgi:hypothetical protein